MLLLCSQLLNCLFSPQVSGSLAAFPLNKVGYYDLDT